MANSRQKILSYILEQQKVTVEQLSRVFRVTPANIRHHLSILIEQGSLKVVGQKNTARKGRPAPIYAIRQQVESNNLERLADALLNFISKNMGVDERVRFTAEIADSMLDDTDIQGTNPTRRLYAVIRALNRMNYQAHWEAHVENPRLMLGHCPYRSIIDQHPELCQVDAAMLQKMLGTPVMQVEKLSTDIKGFPRCVFLLIRNS